jgi:hypothetical protein
MLIAAVCILFVLVFAILIWWSAGQLRDQYVAHELSTPGTPDGDVKLLSKRPERPWFICCYCRAETYGYGHLLENGDRCCSACYSRRA